MTFGINDTQHNTICHYNECRYAKCHNLCIVVLNVVAPVIKLIKDAIDIFVISSSVCPRQKLLSLA